MGTTQISTVSGITLVTLQGSPATTTFMADVFERISALKVNIDMISMPPNHGANAGLSFTISDQDLIDVLALMNTLKTETGIKVIVSSVNHKISVYDPQMKNTPSMAARVFSAIASSDADIRLITTSEVEISFLVTEADYDTVLEAIENAVE
ncbi:MAG: ACT domain-containing protein [Acutalibacteraceae bacterium]